MSFNPSTDGSIIWSYLHTMAANATTEEKREMYISRLNGLKVDFPCENCRRHLVQNLDTLPVEPYSNTNVSLFLHSWKLHDIVNEQLHKPMSQRLSYDQAYAIYFKTKASTSSHSGTTAYRPVNAPRQHAPRQERYMASAARPEHGVEEQSTPMCTSCGSGPVEEPVNQNFTEFRHQQRRTYGPKN